MKIQAPKGTKDVLPEESYRWQYLEALLRTQATRYGFKEIRFPTFEHTELFLRGIGDTTDVVQKEMYTFEDKGNRSITLRPEGTASVVRSIIEHGLYAGVMPLSCYYIAPNFRYEKPAAGRLRQHHQFGVECFGAAAPAADVEVISLAEGYLNQLKIRNVTLAINSIGCPVCRPAYNEKLIEFFQSKKQELCATCHDRLERNPMRILDCKTPHCHELVQSAPIGLDSLCENCHDHFEAVKHGLDVLSIEHTVDPHIVRGLDYYTKTVFEFLTPIEGIPRALCAGGRYDGLVESLGGSKLCGIGFGSGLERLLLVMEEQGVFPEDASRCQLFIANLDSECEKVATLLCDKIRTFNINCQHDLCGRGLKAQMKYADKIGADWVVVIGSDEIANKKVVVKNLRQKITCEVPLEARAIAAVVNVKNL